MEKTDQLGEVIPDEYSQRALTEKEKERSPLDSLQVRQRRFIKRFLKCKNRVQAWKSVYNCKSDASAMVAVNRFLHHHPEVVDWLYQLAGISDDTIADVVVDGFKAEAMSLDRDGKEHWYKDHYARYKAVELGLKLRGKDLNKQSSGNTMNVQIITDSQKGIFRIIEGEEDPQKK